ncbi:hypothetical protein [Photobacterium leiognathi]|nr:hypothetical protein [Photobacterium leiognathi]
MKKVNVEKTKQVRGGLVGVLAKFVVGILGSALAANISAGHGRSSAS